MLKELTRHNGDSPPALFVPNGLAVVISVNSTLALRARLLYALYG
jgi:hypothetical protein